MARKIEKLAMIGLPVLVIVFIFIWAGKSKQPIKNEIDSTVGENQTTSYNVWWQENSTADTTIKDNSVPDGYIKVPGEDNLYMVLDDDNNVKEYVLRHISEDGSSNWEKFNKNISSVMTHVEKDIYKYEEDGKTMYFKYSENSDGTYTVEYVENYEENTENTVEEEIIREAREEDGFIVVYETKIIKTYNSVGELINTRTEGPNVVSKSKDESGMDAKKEWLNGVYASKMGKCDYRDNVSDIIMGLINTKRQELNKSAYSTDITSAETLMAKTCAADLLATDFNYESEFMNELKNKYPYNNMISLTVPHSVGNMSEEIADFVYKQLDGNEDACKMMYGNIYTDAAVCVVNASEGYLIVVIFNVNN